MLKMTYKVLQSWYTRVCYSVQSYQNFKKGICYFSLTLSIKMLRTKDKNKQITHSSTRKR